MNLHQLPVVDRAPAGGEASGRGRAPMPGTTGEHATLLRQVRDGLAVVAATKVDLVRQVQEARDRFSKIDTLGRAVAEVGLIAEAQHVRAHLDAAGSELADIVRRLEAVVATEQQLHRAEQRLVAQGATLAAPFVDAPPEPASAASDPVADPARSGMGGGDRRGRTTTVVRLAGGVVVRSHPPARRGAALVVVLLPLGLAAVAIVSL